jgi:oxygen-independent coproporphyrinogen-3 oxidase
MQKFNTPPLSLYIHLPWCVRKCPYCDFNSHEARQGIPEETYVNALMQDLEEQVSRVADRPVVSIFFGGGTPSLFSAQSIDRILHTINNRLHLTADIEITMEANPGTLDESRFRGFRQAGVNRLSLGIQSLQDEKLKILGRIHNRDYALRAIEVAQRSGFENLNLDLMHGLPQQSLDDALADLTDALARSPTHLSWYQLTIEPNTFFHHQPPQLPPEDTLWQIQDAGQALLAERGFQQYEVSAYSQAERECKHNRNYWEFGDYLGIGAGAHSKITDVEQREISRHWQVKNPRDYMDPAKTFTAEKRVIADHDIVFEFMLNALRLIQGVPLRLFEERTGLTVAALEPHLSIARKKGLLVDDATILCATPLGQRFLNDLTGLFL